MASGKLTKGTLDQKNIHWDFETPAPPEHLVEDAEVFVTNANVSGAVMAEWVKGPKVWHLHVEWEPGNIEGAMRFRQWVEDSLGLTCPLVPRKNTNCH